MAKVKIKTLTGMLDSLEALFTAPNTRIIFTFDENNHDEIVVTIRTGLVEGADDEQLHTVQEIIDLES